MEIENLVKLSKKIGGKMYLWIGFFGTKNEWVF